MTSVDRKDRGWNSQSWQTAGICLLGFLWFWYWRPYGFYGGDSEYLDRQIYQGIWFRNREIIPVLLMQLVHRWIGSPLGWFPSWSIALVSASAGAIAMGLVFRLALLLGLPKFMGFILIATSGAGLIFHGTVEVYALPHLFLIFWIYSIQKVERGDWSPSIPILLAGTAPWIHMMLFFLYPAFAVSICSWRSKLKRSDYPAILGGIASLLLLYLISTWFELGEGPGMRGGIQVLAVHEDQLWGTFWSRRHLELKMVFLFMATHITLPLAFLAGLKFWKDRITRHVLGAMVCALLMWLVLHPDCGELDWDLFLLPGYPTAVLAARWVCQQRFRVAWISLWLGGFLIVWLPTVPVWADLPNRGMGTVEIRSESDDWQIRLDDRYVVTESQIKVQGGCHQLTFKKNGVLNRYRVFTISPGEKIKIHAPIDSPSTGTKSSDTN